MNEGRKRALLNTVWILGLSICILACQESAPEAFILTAPESKTLKGFLALGDSYTIGESVSALETWPYQLSKSLEEEGVELGPLKIIARTGWRTDQLGGAIEAQEEDLEDFSLVSLQIGVNNQFQGEDIEEYRKEFTELLQKAIDLAGGERERVLVLSIPDYGVTPFGMGNAEAIGAEIDAFNAVNREQSALFKVEYFDITPISRQAEYDSSLLASDSLHPSGKMYALWVALMEERVKQKLESL